MRLFQLERLIEVSNAPAVLSRVLHWRLGALFFSFPGPTAATLGAFPKPQRRASHVRLAVVPNSVHRPVPPLLRIPRFRRVPPPRNGLSL